MAAGHSGRHAKAAPLRTDVANVVHSHLESALPHVLGPAGAATACGILKHIDDGSGAGRQCCSADQQRRNDGQARPGLHSALLRPCMDICYILGKAAGAPLDAAELTLSCGAALISGLIVPRNKLPSADE